MIHLELVIVRTIKELREPSRLEAEQVGQLAQKAHMDSDSEGRGMRAA